MTSSFERLPAELLLQIADSLEWHHDQASLCKVSKTLYDTSVADVYERFESCDSVRHYLRTLCHHPELAQLVRTLQFYDNRGKLIGERPSTELSPAEYDLFAAALRKGMDDKSLLEHALSSLKKTGCNAAEMIAICCLTTQIKHLQLLWGEK